MVFWWSIVTALLLYMLVSSPTTGWMVAFFVFAWLVILHFAIDYWVRWRVARGKSFWLYEVVCDTFVDFAPLI